jgi:hypothetical protein
MSDIGMRNHKSRDERRSTSTEGNEENEVQKWLGINHE